MAVKECTVVIHDLNQTAHSLDVTAETLYEAIALASPRCAVTNGSATSEEDCTTVTVTVRRHPEVTHVVKIQDFENWLNTGGKTPADKVLKTRLRQMLGMDKELGGFQCGGPWPYGGN